MAIGDTYASLPELKSYMSLTGTTELDEQLTDALQSSSREINRHCKRHFNRNETVSQRVFMPLSPKKLYVHDFWTLTGLIVETDEHGDGTFETVWAAADYELYPLNGIVDGEPGWPYTKLEAVSSNRFPMCTGYRKATVRVTANWGWENVPPPVKQACLILAAENFQLKDAPLGVAGMGEFGVIRVRNNQMAVNKLANFRRRRMLEAA